MVMHRKYLLIVDNSPCEKQLIDYFAKFNYEIVQFLDLSELDMKTEQPIALLINWTLFKADSSIINNIYHHNSIPIIVISDTDDEDICVQMLEAGADDFLVKPLYPRELHARISAISRRVQRITDTEQEKEIILFADWRLFPAARQIFNSNTHQELQLSAGEYDLLLAFIRQPQRVLGREFLLQITKNSDLNPFDRRIDVQISRLRQKIETDAKKPALIKTIRNGGYLFTPRVLLIKESEEKKPKNNFD
ncbi:MAG: response regulator transcription factor [Tatlockia sp.]|nr:response regulator transcription factor [Tatlockia sp.]